MTKAEWEKTHNYNNARKCCGNCKFVKVAEKDPWNRVYKCEKRMEAGAGENVKVAYCCDLWEAE